MIHGDIQEQIDNTHYMVLVVSLIIRCCLVCLEPASPCKILTMTELPLKVRDKTDLIWQIDQVDIVSGGVVSEI